MVQFKQATYLEMESKHPLIKIIFDSFNLVYSDCYTTIRHGVVLALNCPIPQSSN